MPQYIIHKDGAYNIFTTIADGACYDGALTLEQLREVIKDEYGEQGMRDLPARLERAHESGCSGRGWTLDDCIDSNRQGPNEKRMPKDEFVRRYLTLPSEADTLSASGGGDD
jgi:hypothetical protein